MPRSVRSLSRTLLVVVLAALGCGPEVQPDAIGVTRQAPGVFATPGAGARQGNGGNAAGHGASGTVLGAAGQGVILALSGDATASTSTDVNGDFSFDGLADGSYQVTPQKDGFKFQPQSVWFTVNGSNVGEQNFLALPVPIAHGIFGTISHGPADSITIDLTGPVHTEASTQADGGYAFEGLADGTYLVTPSLGGYTFTPPQLSLTVSGADVTGADFLAQH